MIVDLGVGGGREAAGFGTDGLATTGKGGGDAADVAVATGADGTGFGKAGGGGGGGAETCEDGIVGGALAGASDAFSFSLNFNGSTGAGAD